MWCSFEFTVSAKGGDSLRGFHPVFLTMIILNPYTKSLMQGFTKYPFTATHSVMREIATMQLQDTDQLSAPHLAPNQRGSHETA